MPVTFSYSATYKQKVSVVEQVDLISTVVVGDQSNTTNFSVP